MGIENRKDLIDEEDYKFEMKFLIEDEEKAEFLKKSEVWLKTRVSHEKMEVEIGEAPVLIEENLEENLENDTFDKTIKFKDFYVSLKLVKDEEVDDEKLEKTIAKINHQLDHIKTKLIEIEEERAELKYASDESKLKKQKCLEQIKVLLQKKINLSK